MFSYYVITLILLKQESISSTFFVPIFCTKFWHQKLQSWNVTRESCAICFHTKKVQVKCWWSWHQVYVNHSYCPLIWWPIMLKLKYIRLPRNRLHRVTDKQRWRWHCYAEQSHIFHALVGRTSIQSNVVQWNSVNHLRVIKITWHLDY